VCLYLIHKGHLRHQEDSKDLLVLLEHFVTDAFDEQHSYESLPRTSFKESNCVPALCLLKHLELVLPRLLLSGRLLLPRPIHLRLILRRRASILRPGTLSLAVRLSLPHAMAEHHLAAAVALPETPRVASVVIMALAVVAVAVALTRPVVLPPSAPPVLPPTGWRRGRHRTPPPVVAWSPGTTRRETLALAVPAVVAAIGRGDRELPPGLLPRFHGRGPLRHVRHRHRIVGHGRSRLLQLRLWLQRSHRRWRWRRRRRRRRRRRCGGGLGVDALEYPVDLGDEAVIGAAVHGRYEARVEVGGRGEVDAAEQGGAVLARVVPVRRRRVLAAGVAASSWPSRHLALHQQLPRRQLQATTNNAPPPVFNQRQQAQNTFGRRGIRIRIAEEAKTNVATTCSGCRGGGGRTGPDRAGPNHGERVEEKEAVINRTNHASAGRGGARVGREWRVESGGAMEGWRWRCWIPMRYGGCGGAEGGSRFDSTVYQRYSFSSLSLSLCPSQLSSRRPSRSDDMI
jgi:hypothetical protein